jgi:hypothetical protein
MMNDRREPVQAAPAGLCATCRHARTIVTDRGSRFIRCGRSATDDRYPRYPRLPVLACPGYEPVDERFQ